MGRDSTSHSVFTLLALCPSPYLPLEFSTASAFAVTRPPSDSVFALLDFGGPSLDCSEPARFDLARLPERWGTATLSLLVSLLTKPFITGTL